jgi:hypothetical protein
VEDLTNAVPPQVSLGGEMGGDVCPRLEDFSSAPANPAPSLAAVFSAKGGGFPGKSEGPEEGVPLMLKDSYYN